MAIASSMKGLAGQIVASHNMRVKALGDLTFYTRNTLRDFAEERRLTGRKQRTDLQDFVHGLCKSVEDMLKDFRKNHSKMSSGQAKDLSDFAAALTKTVKNMIGDSRDVSSTANSFRKTRGRMSAELKSGLARDAKNIEAYVKNKLKEFEESHGEMSDALRKSLAAYVNDMTRGVKKLLREYDADMTQARNFWETTASGLRIETAMPSVEITGKVTTVRGAIEKEAPQAEEPHQDVDIEEKVLGHINDQRGGVKVGDMEPVFGVPRMRLGVIAKKLMDEGKIRKEGNLYYPV